VVIKGSASEIWCEINAKDVIFTRQMILTCKLLINNFLESTFLV